MASLATSLETPGWGARLRHLAKDHAALLFGTWSNAVISLASIAIAAYVAFHLYAWAWRDAVFRGTAADCRAAHGACWAFIADKLEFTIFGVYPFADRWRAALALGLIAAMIGISLLRSFWRPWLPFVWVVLLGCAFVLLRGGILGLDPVPMRNWSGMIVTVWLAVLGLAVSYPLGIALALGRRSKMRVVRYLSIGWIEVVRGVPLVSILFMASVVVPLFLPEGVEVDNLVRAQIAFILFGSAYLAEVFRGGLQGISPGQHEAATALGLGYWRSMFLVVLPQALKLVIPPQLNTFIAIFKDTTLVLVIGIFDFLGTIKAMLSDTAWLGFATEAYVFAASVYFVICFGMSLYSSYLEKQLRPAQQ